MGRCTHGLLKIRLLSKKTRFKMDVLASESVYHIVRNPHLEGSMKAGQNPDGLRLTEDEAFSILSLCLTSPNRLDITSERALRKLAEYCTNRSNPSDNHINLEFDQLSENARAI